MDYAAFTVKYHGRAYQLISDAVIAKSGFNEIPSSGHQRIKAMWDTGATGSMITEAAASSLELTPVGCVEVAGIHDVQEVNQYLIDIVFTNTIAFQNIMVTATKSFALNFQAVIGMDIIGEGGLAVTSRCDGGTTLSFIVPNLEEINFAERL